MRRGTACVVGLIAGLVAASPAWAGGTTQGGFRYQTGGGNVPPGTTQTLKLACPDNRSVLSGGANIFNNYGTVFISASYPYDDKDRGSAPDDGWKTRVSTFDRWRGVTLYAICAPFRPKYETGRGEIPADGSLSFDIGCGQGQHIIHGGYKGPPGTLPGSSLPNGPSDSWSIGIYNRSLSDGVLKGYAVCSNRIDPAYVSGAGSLPAAGQNYAEADCPGGQPHVIGGGQQNPEPSGVLRLVADTPDPSFGQWEAGLDNDEDATTFTVWAVCSVPLA